jgi:rhamnosyltransferase
MTVTPSTVAPPDAGEMAAVLVLFDLRSGTAASIASLAGAVKRLFIVDNSTSGHPAVSDAAALPPNASVLVNGNAGGLAGAYNAALRALGDVAGADAVRHVVFVDDDSDTASLSAFLAHPSTRSAFSRPDTAAVAPAHRDRATGLRARHLELSRWRFHHLPREFTGTRPVAFVINSMSVWSLAALRRVGPYNEGLAVDHVDTEYCMRARRTGLHVLVNGDCEFAHSVGERKSYRVLGMTLQSGGHSARRRGMIGRNTMWLATRYALVEPAFSALCLLRLAYEATGIALVEDRRLAKLAHLSSGALAGICCLAHPPRAGIRR